jgi:hypothetical protein
VCGFLICGRKRDRDGMSGKLDGNVVWGTVSAGESAVLEDRHHSRHVTTRKL